MNPKKWLYELHEKFGPPSPEAVRTLAPLMVLPAAYAGHKWITRKTGAGIAGLGRMMGSPTITGLGRGIESKSDSGGAMTFALTSALAAWALAKGLYSTEDRDPARQQDWKSFFYGVDKEGRDRGLEKQADLQTAAAALQQGWGDDALLGYHMKKLNWLTPSVNVREMKDTIWDTPGFTPGQKTFLRDSVDGAVQASGNPDLVSRNDLGIGAQRAIVNHADKVPGLWSTAAKATALAAQGAFLGNAMGLTLGAPKPIRTALTAGGTAAAVLNSSDVMKAVGSVF